MVPDMTPYQIRAFRDRFNLSRESLALLLETDGTTIKKMEMPTNCRQYRKPAARMVLVMKAYAAGFRP
jgi:DNA-binding transcriptional regulator YiaG